MTGLILFKESIIRSFLAIWASFSSNWICNSLQLDWSPQSANWFFRLSLSLLSFITCLLSIKIVSCFCLSCLRNSAKAGTVSVTLSHSSSCLLRAAMSFLKSFIVLSFSANWFLSRWTSEGSTQSSSRFCKSLTCLLAASNLVCKVLALLCKSFFSACSSSTSWYFTDWITSSTVPL